jgi:hypothetical protein
MTDKEFEVMREKTTKYAQLKEELANNQRLLDELQEYPNDCSLTLSYISLPSGKHDLTLPSNLTFRILEDICGELVNKIEELRKELNIL